MERLGVLATGSPAEVRLAAKSALAAAPDRFILAALRQCAHALQPLWFAALRRGTLDMPDSRHLAFALQQTTGQAAAKVARDLLANGSIGADDEAFAPLLMLLATQGNRSTID